jgi:hypothetical protein
MGYLCVVASTFKEALALLEKENPSAAVLDPQQDSSSPAGIVAAFHRMVPSLRGRSIVLTSEESDPELLKVLEAYALPRVPRDLVLQELWPCLDSLLHQNIVPQHFPRRARLIFDSFLETLPAGVRSSQLSDHRLLYDSAGVIADLSIEPQSDSQRVTLVGQVADTAQPERPLERVPIVLQGQAAPLGVTTTNESGEFHFDFEFQPGATLEIGLGRNHWVSIKLPDPKLGTR